MIPGPLFFLPLGRWWLDPAFTVLVEAATVGPTGTHVFTRPIGPLFPRGLALAWQVGAMSAGNLIVGTPTVVILD